MLLTAPTIQDCARQLLGRNNEQKTALITCIRSPVLCSSQRTIGAANLKWCAKNARVASASHVCAVAAEEVSDPDFDWGLALVLAGCSFEAYNGLADQAVDKSLVQLSASGTQTTYVDSAFIKDKLAGVMEVTVKSATKLSAADWWPGSKADPYTIVSIGRSLARTTTKKQTLNPEWNEKHYLFVRSPTDRVSIRMLDEDIDSDDVMGVAVLPVAELLNSSDTVTEKQIELRNLKGGSAGTVSISFRFLSFADQGTVEDARSSMGAPVLGSPASEMSASPWRVIRDELIPAEAAADAVFDPVAFIDNPDTDTQLWVFWNPELKKVCLAYRGTEQTKWKDVFTDLSLVPSGFNPEDVDETGKNEDMFAPASKAFKILQAGLSSSDDADDKTKKKDIRLVLAEAVQAAAKPTSGDLWVHSGFLKAYRSIQSDVLALLDMLFEGEKEPWTLYITGHSLGGALSTLSTYDCAKRRNWKGAKPDIVMYNFGSPRVGNSAFAAEFDALVPNAWRVVNRNDAVSLVPRMMGFSHVGHKLTLDVGKHELEWRSSQGLGEGKAFQEVAAGMVAASIVGSAANGTPDDLTDNNFSECEYSPKLNAADEVQTLIEQEMVAMNALMDGKAVEEHLEPIYMENLKAAVKKAIG